MPPSAKTHYDVVIVGAGHNGLVAAAYLAKAGLSVLMLEARDHVGGAAISKQVFPGIDARLSVYSYLVSLFPQKIVADLGLKFEARRRAVASFTPTIRDDQHRALLISNTSEQETEESFRRFTGRAEEYGNFRQFQHLTGLIAERIWPTLLEPLVTRQDIAERFDTPDARAAWQMFIEQPLGEILEASFQDDIVRGAVFTDAKIGVLTHPQDPSLLQNRTFLYHIIGNATGEWRVPIGGMGALTGELERVARSAGVEIVTSASVERIAVNSNSAEIAFLSDDHEYNVGGKYILANVAPAVLAKLLPDHKYIAEVPNGSVFKINMLLQRLPRLRADGYRPERAFAGTFHIDEGYSAMQDSYHSAASGAIPAIPPGEVYCHTLTDPSILSPQLQAAGYHTLTLFGLDMPFRLFAQNNDATRQEVLARYLRGINHYLAEPIEDCLALDRDGKPCIEAKSPLDLQTELGIPGGNIFHNALTWPFVENSEQRGTWGVETPYGNVFLCGSGAMRGGCVSGIPGHNAAMKVLECLR
jgi:phytoene dehydrogenase-like protein